MEVSKIQSFCQNSFSNFSNCQQIELINPHFLKVLKVTWISLMNPAHFKKLPPLIRSCLVCSIKKQPPRSILWKRCFENMQQIYRGTSMPKCNFNKVKQLYSNRTSAWVFSCKFAVYFQNTFPKNNSGRLLLGVL